MQDKSKKESEKWLNFICQQALGGYWTKEEIKKAITSFAKDYSALIPEEDEKTKIERDNKKKELKDIILKEYEKGNIVINTIDGLKAANLKKIIEQPVDGLLYDLNRNEAVILTFIDDSKWINDYAMCKVVRQLKSKLDEIKNEKR